MDSKIASDLQDQFETMIKEREATIDVNKADTIDGRERDASGVRDGQHIDRAGIS